MPPLLPRTCCLALTALAAACSGQESRPSLSLDGRELAGARATLDPLGSLDLRAADSGWRLRFSPLEWPPAGAYEVAAATKGSQLQVALLDPQRGELPLAKGRIEVAAFGPERVKGTLEYASEQDQTRRRVSFDLRPDLAPAEPAVVRDAKPVPAFTAPKDAPVPEDLVFCAFGRHGTGLPGQRAVAESVARLAATGPLDFVVLLGDSFLPRGVQAIADPQWHDKFEMMYDAKRLPVTFYAVAGPSEWAGKIEVVEGYAKSHERFVFKHPPGVSFTARSHGKTLAFFLADTTRMIGPLQDPFTRGSLRSVTQEMSESKADWKIVFGYDGFQTLCDATLAGRVDVMHTRFEHRLKEYQADAYVCANERVLQLFRPKDGVTYVTSGGGGGPELAAPTRWTEDTVFAATGGGFTWFRFDGKGLEISFRDAAGKALYSHVLQKP